MAENTSIDPTIKVINQTDSLEELEKQYMDYCSLTLDMARLSDDECLKRHGMTNTQLYNYLKGKLLDNMVNGKTEDDLIIGVREGFELPIDMEDTKDMEDDDALLYGDNIIKKVEVAKSMLSDTCVIIYPFTYKYPYTINDIDELFRRFNNLSFDLQQLSDQECIRLFGNDNRFMYEINRAKLLAAEEAEESEQFSADSYFGAATMFVSNESTSLLDIMIKKMDMTCIKESHNVSLAESVMADDGLNTVDAAITVKKSASEAVPEFVPYLFPTEIDQYIGDGSGLSPASKEFIEAYKTAMLEGLGGFNSKRYFDTIKSLYEARLQNESQTDTINKTMINYGWNPNLPFNERSFEGARKRISSYINEYCNPTLVDITKFSEDANVEFTSDSPNTIDHEKSAIYFVDIYNGGKYFGFDPYLSRLFGKDIIHSNSIDDDSDATIYVFFVNEQDKYTLLDFLNHNPIPGGSIFNNLDNPKVVAAKILYIVSRICKSEVSTNAKVYKIFSDKWKHFSDYRLGTLVHSLAADSSDIHIGEVLPTLSAENSPASKLVENKSISYLKHMKIRHESGAYSILEEMKDLVTPNIVIHEAKNIPFRINDKGIVVDLPSIIEEEYQTIHKSLLVYDEKENYEAMKDSLAHLWYLNLLCERKITKWKTKENKEQQLKVSRDVRARILNDFKKYLKKVIEYDKEFDFTSYFKKSKWNDRSLFIDIQTLKYTGKIIAAILKSIF